MPVLLEACTGRIDFLLLWRVSSTVYETNKKVKTRFEDMYHARVNCSRGKRHGDEQCQKTRPLESKRRPQRASKNNHDSIVLRCQNDEKYQESQKVHGWTEDHCRYLERLLRRTLW